MTNVRLHFLEVWCAPTRGQQTTTCLDFGGSDCRTHERYWYDIQLIVVVNQERYRRREFFRKSANRNQTKRLQRLFDTCGGKVEEKTTDGLVVTKM